MSNDLTQNDVQQITALLMGRTVVKLTDNMLQLDDGTILTLKGHEGCGGCTNGWYDLKELNGCDNIITNVELANDNDEVFNIFVYAANQKVNLATFKGTDNGWYGVGYHITVDRINQAP